MSLNNIQLTQQVAAALYSRSLIEAEVTDKGSIESSRGIDKTDSEHSRKYLGNNEKKILIAVNYPDTTHLPDEELSFLTSILGACKLTLGDVAIINMSNYVKVSYKDLIDTFNSQSVLLFGVEPSQFGLPIDFPQYQVQAFDNCKFLFSPALEKRHEDELFKSKLWVSLRRIFEI